MENSMLQTISLGSNRIGGDGTKWLAQVFERNSTLQVIDLFSNNIGNQGAKYMAEEIKANANSLLQEVKLGRNEIDIDLESQIDALLEKNYRTFLCEFTYDQKEKDLIRLRFDEMILRFLY
jgi:hypothetical protein